MRVQVTAGIAGDGQSGRVYHQLTSAGFAVRSVRQIQVYIIDGLQDLTRADAEHFLSDPVAEVLVSDKSEVYRDDWSLLVEVAYRPGVANPVATTLTDALADLLGPLPDTTLVQTATQLLIDLTPGTVFNGDDIAAALHNPLIEQATVITRDQWNVDTRPPERYPIVAAHEVPPVARFDLVSLDDAGLRELSEQRLLALDLAELRAIREYYSQPEVSRRRADSGLGSQATDVEIEMIAQTWSEHCKHKIFAARISYTETNGQDPEPEIIDGLFQTYIRDTTAAVAPDDSFVKSVFHDNAGVVVFDEETLLCFKAETHNSPSALDPYGGAITGIVGVNRDILGTGKGARPIFNTNVLCFGDPDTPADSLPQGLLHPSSVLSGVHRGIVDGGNQSGIPVAAGAFLFDESYVGKPLVFCGTGGVLPARIGGEDAWVHHITPGDHAVMVGGRIGKDGIHGATFSSLGLDESSPTSAVQIGDPITQRRMTDFLMEARDNGLYQGITDNGAGGLSSSLGEMARESGGIEIDLDLCPLKYEGLAAWEILVSESQERMSLAVSPKNTAELVALAESRGVEATAVGTFTNDGFVRVRHRSETVAELDLDFLHDGLPRMELSAVWPGPGQSAPGSGPADPAKDPRAGTHAPADPAAQTDPPPLHGALLEVLADPNIASKEHLVRQYDHEVQGGSIVKPMCGASADGPTDGAVLKPRYDSWRGISVTHGLNPRYGDSDTYWMAAAAVDEAVRAHVCLGGDPRRMAALDNFCWPDPVLSESTPDGPFKLAQLVRACKGLADACKAYGLPLISGKDSMKNDSYLGGRKVSIRPTLLVSLAGIVPDIRSALTTDFKQSGDRVVVFGTGTPALGGSAYARRYGDTVRGSKACPRTQLQANARLYDAVHSAALRGLFRSLHDASEGGIAIALAESVIGGRQGATVVLAGDDVTLELLGERTGTFIASCAPDHVDELLSLLRHADPQVYAEDIGEVTSDQNLRITSAGDTVSWSIDELVAAWESLARSLGSEPRRDAKPAGGPHGPIAATHEPRHSHDDSAEHSPAASIRGAGRAGSRKSSPEVLLLTGYGINAERELGRAFESAGATTRMVHLNDLLADPTVLKTSDVLALPGGFSYGDHVASGLMLAHRLKTLANELNAFRDEGKLILGICNGFQVLCKLGILPDLSGGWKQEVSLIHNDSGVFEDSWVSLSVEETNSPWLTGIRGFDAPIRHGEGRFVVDSDATLSRLEAERLVALRYLGRNPNGSTGAIAGIVDRTGLVLGMMPHPEAFLVPQNHPRMNLSTAAAVTSACGRAQALFRNAVEYSERRV